MATRWWCRTSSGLLIGQQLPVYFAFALLKHVIPLHMLIRLAWRRPTTTRDFGTVKRLAALALRTAQLAGLSDRNCLQCSLLLYRVLSRVGADPVIVVGFRRVGGKLSGHAWVVVDGLALADTADNVAGFEPMFGFGRQGALLRPNPTS